MTEHRVTPVVESRPVVGGAAAGRGLEVVTGAADPPSFARTLPRDAQQVRAARLMVSQALDTWGLTALGDSARLVLPPWHRHGQGGLAQRWRCEAADVPVLWLGSIQSVECGEAPFCCCLPCIQRMEALIAAHHRA